VQQDVVIVSQGDIVILKGEKCGGLYKLKEENSVRWSFKDKFGREFITRWNFKKNCNGT